MIDFLLFESYDYMCWLYLKKMREALLANVQKHVKWGPTVGWRERTRKGPFLEKSDTSPSTDGLIWLRLK